MKKDEFDIIKTEEIELNFYAVRSKDGKWLRAKKHNIYHGDIDSRGSWTDNLAEAKIYTKPGPAKSQITFWGTNYPTFGVPDLVRIATGKCEFLDQAGRVKKAAEKKKLEEAKRMFSRCEYNLEVHQAKVKLMRGDGKDSESLKLKKALEEATKNLQLLQNK